MRACGVLQDGELLYARVRAELELAATTAGEHTARRLADLLA